MLPEGFILRMQSLLGEEYAAFSASFDRPLCTRPAAEPAEDGLYGRSVPLFPLPCPVVPDGVRL